MVRGASPAVQQIIAHAAKTDVDCNNMSGREICRIRRQALSESGKSVLAQESRGERSRAEALRAMSRNRARPAVADTKESTIAAETQPAAASSYPAGSFEAGLETLCSVVESQRDTSLPGAIRTRARELCMARREALAQNGKKAMQKRKTSQGTVMNIWRASESWRAAQRRGLSGREVAQARREELCAQGRGDCAPRRPSGRLRPAPVKVERSTTLAGSDVSGTTLEQRLGHVTGTESGTCRSVTGTEYLGQEHFAEHCDSIPDAAPTKVRSTITGGGLGVSGSIVGGIGEITGDETGACRSVTGTAYLGMEDLLVCGKAPATGPAKVGAMFTRAGESVSGSTLGRSQKVTGDETGSCRDITGTEYLNTDQSEVPCSNATSTGSVPKVGVMHTLRGKQLTGTSVAAAVGVTGTEAGGCKPVTGTEYMGAEEFNATCGSTPSAGGSKVQVSRTAGSQSMTGTLVNRSQSVTGGEPGECRTLTGTQYDVGAADPNSTCATGGSAGPVKVGVMHTLKGREVSGTSVAGSIHVTGDEYGGCKPITGTEYVGAEYFDSFCSSRPDANPDKVTANRTWNAQTVTGTAVGRSTRVTGDEYGTCKPITGTAYFGPDQVEAFCAPSALQEGEARTAVKRQTPAMPVTGSQSGSAAGVTGADRGVCSSITGMAYVSADQMPEECGEPEGYVEPRQGEFSVMTPARAALHRRERSVTGTAYDGMSSITGPSSKALGLISGTPEFRHQPPAARNAAVKRDATAKVEDEKTPEARTGRITGNGSEDGVSITGDSWNRGSSVTGAEGKWAMRNASQGGRGVGMALANARTNRELERPEVAESRITGSAGSSDAGAAVTVSGGARA